MDLKIENKNENKSFSRIEIVAKISFAEKATPNRKEVQKNIAKEVKSDEKLVIIKQIKTKFGDSSAIVTAFVYQNADVMNKLERKNLIAKHGITAEPETSKTETDEPVKTPEAE